MTACLNCGHFFKGNFCPECGQKASTKKLTAAVLLEDTLHFFTHLEHGFLFTAKSFLIHPGTSSLKYLAGKRKPYQTPVSFFLIWTGLYLLLHNTIINYRHFHVSSQVIRQVNIREESNLLFRHHLTLFTFPVIIVSALLLYYIMARPKFNFTEILTLSLYGAGVYFMMSLVSDGILGFIFKINILSTPVFLWQGILSSLYNFWFSFDFFKRLHIKLFWLRLVSVSILIAICGWLLMFYLPMAWVYFFE